MKQYRNYLIDLDGTVTDSGKAIMDSVRYALGQLGLPEPDEGTLRLFIGPSLMDSFRNVLKMDEEEAARATRIYRKFYEAGKMYDVTVYPGVREALMENVRRGRKNFLVTSKPHVFAEKIIEKIGLAPYFHALVGPEFDDPSSDKARLILKSAKDYGLDLKDCLMIGDTRFDMEGARKAGVDSAGVLYGYGTKEELLKAHATYLLSDLREIL